MLDNPYPWGSIFFWSYFVYGFLVWLAWQVRPRVFGPIAALALTQGAWVTFTPVNYGGNTVKYLVDLQAMSTAAQSLLVTCLIAAFWAWHPRTPTFKRYFGWGLTALCGLAVLSRGRWDHLIFTNPAIAVIVATSLLPLAARALPLWLFLPLLGANIWGVYLTNETIGWVLLGVWGLYELARPNGAIAGLATAGLAWQAYFHWWDRIVYHWEARLPTWQLMIDHVWAHSPWVGMGPGSTWAQVRYLQYAAQGNQMTEAFLMAHNDYLQLFYELGILGLLAGGAAWGATLWKARKKPAVLPALLCWSVAALVHFPLHDPISVLAITWTAWLAWA